MTEELEPLSSELQQLFEGERNREIAAPDARFEDALLARVEMAVALLPSGPGGGGASGGGHAGGAGVASAAKMGGSAIGAKAIIAAVAFTLGAGAGAVGTHAMSSSRDSSAQSAASTSAVTSNVSPLPASSSSDFTISADALPIASASTSAQVDAPTSSASSADLSRERELLDVARAALAHGRPDDAIAALQRHARTWPHGALAEEREVVWVQALAAAGRHTEAEQRASAFRKTFPNSMFLPVIDDAVRAP